jgi:SAM-dependent methyltransferase
MQAEAGRQLTIHWVVQGVAGSDAKGYTSDLATNRYRAIIPARELRSRGHQVHFISAYDWQWDIANPPDVVVLGKLLISQDSSEFLRLSQRVLAQANRALAQGVAVIADFNDDHFDHPVLGHHWRSAAALATLCTAGSNSMASAVTRHARGPVVVVGDPIASPACEPRVFCRASGVSRLLSRLLPTFGPPRLKLVWYGHPNNWRAMEHWARDLEALSKEQPLLIWLVTKPSQKIQAWVDAFNRKNAPAALVEWVQWDEETQWSYVRDADAVLLPSDPAHPKLAVKSSNRLTDALNAGRYVVASAVPSYRPFDAYCSLTDEPVKALQWMIQNPDQALAMVSAGRNAVERVASVACVAEEWGLAFTSAMKANQARRLNDGLAPSSVADPHQQTSRIRLNLGCGDKILPGYINVDVAPSRAGRQPDVICDLRDLSVLGADYADEVLAVHVVEHFWRWEVEDILRGWVRVLKPGGRMILECPNLISACEEFLKDPVSRCRPSQDGQRTMWVFYGDPSWQDPLMVHRWAYTPNSLSELLRAVGLVDVRQEPAQYKLREPRDMRVTGRKAFRS